MEVNIKMDAHEIRRTLGDGTLAALAESVCSVDRQPPAGAAAGEPRQTMPAAAPQPVPAAVQPVPAAAPQPVPLQQGQPAYTPAQPAPALVPTTAPAYTLQALAMAGTQLVDAGRRQEVLDLLTSFGARALTELPKEQYGAYAAKLREMGAKI